MVALAGVLSGCGRGDAVIFGVVWVFGTAVVVALSGVAAVVGWVATVARRREERAAAERARRRSLLNWTPEELAELPELTERVRQRMAEESRRSVELERGERRRQRRPEPVETFDLAAGVVVWASVPFAEGERDDEGRTEKDRLVLVCARVPNGVFMPLFQVVPLTSKVDKYRGRRGFVEVSGGWSGPGSVSCAKAAEPVTLPLSAMRWVAGPMGAEQVSAVAAAAADAGRGDVAAALGEVAAAG